MTAFALILLLAAGIAHAGWNYIAKRSGGGPVFVWLFAIVSSLAYAPLALTVGLRVTPAVGLPEAGIVFATILVHLIYFLLLQRGYQAGDLSVVYPLARGTGPALSILLAIVIFQERPSALAIAGGLLVAGGVFALAGGSCGNPSRSRRAIVYGLLTGVSIATYTLVDKLSVSTFHIPPLMLVLAIDIGRVLLLAPVACARWQETKQEWRQHRWQVIAVGLLSPLSYLLVLTALVTTPVSYIAPAREVSILIGTVMGTRWLSEGEGRRRVPSAAAIVLGLVALAVG